MTTDAARYLATWVRGASFVERERLFRDIAMHVRASYSLLQAAAAHRGWCDECGGSGRVGRDEWDEKPCRECKGDPTDG